MSIDPTRITIKPYPRALIIGEKATIIIAEVVAGGRHLLMFVQEPPSDVSSKGTRGFGNERSLHLPGKLNKYMVKCTIIIEIRDTSGNSDPKIEKINKFSGKKTFGNDARRVKPQ